MNILKQNNLCEKDFCICTQGELSIKPRVGVCVCVCACVFLKTIQTGCAVNQTQERACAEKKEGFTDVESHFPYGNITPDTLKRTGEDEKTGHPKKNWGRCKDKKQLE